MEQDARESAPITRGQNVIYVMPHDWASIAQVLAPLLDRVDDAAPDVQLLVITADAEAAAAASAAVVRLVGSRAIRALAATSARRAGRLLQLRHAQVVAGAPNQLLDLVRSATLKLGQVRVVVLAWVDELLSTGEEGGLETLMAEVPKEAARVVVANEMTPAVEGLVERYARRARRVAPSASESDSPTAIAYLTVSAVSRAPALRRLLDDLDPDRAVVYVRTDESEREAREVLRLLGYHPDAEDATVRVARSAGAEPLDLLVLYDVPASREELREAAGTGERRIVALAQPRQLAGLRTLAGGGTVTPLTLSGAATRARDREALLRAEVRGVLSQETFARELLALEPLLDDYDGIEIAAATLRLLERSRHELELARARPAETRAAAPAPGAMTRLYINVGAMDNTRAGDLVGFITSEAGISGAQIGRIDVRDNHSLVEVSSELASETASRLTGKSMRGRRVVARLDQERPSTSTRRGAGGGFGRGERGERGERRDRPPRGAQERGGERRPRHSRQEGRSERPPRNSEDRPLERAARRPRERE